MKKIVKICLISFVLIVVFACVLCGSLIAVSYAKYQSIPLNTESLTSPSLSIDIYDKDNIPIKEENQFNGDFCKLSSLHQYTKDAFISIEDKDFYKHNGLNKKRIIKAIINNLKSMSLKEGASTISQQLIKNTHLSNEKTFERKLKEMVLTKKLEKNFSKDEILESYLNIIFFGNNCYGLESASKYYFNKDAEDLNLNESCTLAGMIKSPSKYSPILHYENSVQRRNLVLSEMEKDGKISIDEKINTQNQPITLDITQKNQNKLNTYSQASIDEASKILKIPAKQIAIAGYKIHTYLNTEKQTALKNALENNEYENIDNAGIVIDSTTHGVTAFQGNSNFKVLDLKRQPASCLKPLLVYAPALNEGVVSPSTQILDEPIKIGSYSPSNVNKKFSGYISVTDAVKNSINIPAIKVLSYIGIDTGKQYAQKLGIDFDEQDDSYALALGGMTYGVNIKDLATAYTTFANNGEFSDSTFIQYITDKNNKLVYIHKPISQMVFREDSAYLMTNILQETAKSGTSRKLSTITNTEIASKTGTVGKKNLLDNLDKVGEKLFDFPKDYEDDLFSAQTLTRAFIKIQDGCNNFCTYCLIPYLRGRSRSRSEESIISEVEKLPGEVKEIVLVGIDVSDFKIDGKKGLGILLSDLDKYGKRLRLSSMEDNLIDESFLKTLSGLKNFCPHFHLSLQSGCDNVLKKMNRHYTTKEFFESVKLIRKYFPMAGITTDIIVGFPTETEEDFEDTLKFVEKVKFSQLHIFPYSKRNGTVATKLYKDLPGQIKKARLKRLEILGKKLKTDFINQNKSGKVLIEEKNGNYFEGYTENYIKCYIDADVKVGDVVDVKIVKPFKDGAVAELLKD